MRIVKLERKAAFVWMEQKHYAHTRTNVKEVFGLLEGSVVEGVCCFGNPVCKSYVNFLGTKTFELARLCVNEGLPKNTLSKFVAGSLKMLPKPAIVVSFADANQGHHGYIYQATNWIYTGAGKPYKAFVRDGKEVHKKTLHRLGFNTTEFFSGMGFHTENRLGKHRYFFIVASSKKERKAITKKLLEHYERLPYPKGDNTRYDSGDDIVQRLDL